MSEVKTAAKKSPEALDKLAEGYRYVTIPAEDIYDHPFDGIWINNQHFKPGTHLVDPQVADTLEDRLRVWQAAMIRLMRPSNDKKTVATMAKQGLNLTQPAPADTGF